MATKSNIRSYTKKASQGLMYREPKQKGAALKPDPAIAHNSKKRGY